MGYLGTAGCSRFPVHYEGRRACRSGAGSRLNLLALGGAACFQNHLHPEIPYFFGFTLKKKCISWYLFFKF